MGKSHNIRQAKLRAKLKQAVKDAEFAKLVKTLKWNEKHPTEGIVLTEPKS